MRYNEVLLGLRKKYNFSQKEVATKINVTQRAYAFYEKGEREPSIDTLLKLSDIYNVPVDVIIGKYEIPEIKENANKETPKRGRKPKKDNQ